MCGVFMVYKCVVGGLCGVCSLCGVYVCVVCVYTVDHCASSESKFMDSTKDLK